MSSQPVAPDTLAREATERVLDILLRRGAPCLIVDSPPGAGKTHLVEAVVAVTAQHLRLRVAVAVPQNEQVFDLLRRLAAHFPFMGVQPFLSESRSLPAELAALPELLPTATHVQQLRVPHGVVVGTVAKFVTSSLALGPRAFDVLICDEAYQVAFRDFAPLSMLAAQVLLVGDPGQLPPLVKVDTGPFEAAPVKVHWPAPQELVRRFPEVDIVRLPVTRRLPQDTVDLIQPSHYPNLPFVSAAPADERRLRCALDGLGDPVDEALRMLAAGATLVGILLPEREYPVDDVDDDVGAMMAHVVDRMLKRQIEMGGTRLLPRDIGCSDAHVASNAAVARHLRSRHIPTDEVIAETPEQWQGLQRALMVVKHPLSGRRRLDAFDLDPGRWCVMLSRHLGGCMIVGRDGIGAVLEKHQHDCATRPMQATDLEWIGWQAHSALWRQLESKGRLIRI
jgi:hypothetical protein